MNIKSDYINKINVLALIFIVIYCLSYVFHDIDSSHNLIYILTRFITNLGFPLLIMTFGSLMLKKQENPLDFVKNSYKILIPIFILWNVILSIVVIYYNGLYLFVTTITKINWFMWVIISNILVIPILSEFIYNEKNNGIKYLLVMFIISSIALSLSVQLGFSLYFIDLVFFAEPLSFMVLGYYLHNKEFKLSSYKLFIICLCILLITLFLRVSLIINGTAEWNAYFTQIFGTTLEISIDPFTIIEASTIFLMIKSLNDVFNNNLLINFYSKNIFSFILLLGIFTFIISQYTLPYSWIKLTILFTFIFLITGGILFFVLQKIPLLRNLFNSSIWDIYNK